MPPSEITLYTSLLFDPLKKQVRKNISITVSKSTGQILKIYPREKPLEILPEGDIDLRSLFVLPGLIDAHTHIFLHPYTETPAIVQMREESPAERMVRAVNHCRAALLAGYTTYRDLGTEGMGSHDVGIRDAINRDLTPGPRLFVATDALASTQGYQPRTENLMGGHIMPNGSDEGDGVVGVRQAVRRRIALGADIIKFYADYRRRSLRWPATQGLGAVCCPPLGSAGGEGEVNPEIPLFRQEEMDEIVKEARLARCPVAAHAGSLPAALMAAKAGVTSIEHVYSSSMELWETMKRNGVVYVPTLAVCELFKTGDELRGIMRHTKQAYDVGVKIGCGGDTGTFAHGENVRELELMVQAGIPVEDVLEACTVGGFEACGGGKRQKASPSSSQEPEEAIDENGFVGMKFGWFAEGNRADIIALRGSPLEDIKALREVDFVMKDGKVWKMEGNAVGMI